MIKAISVSGFQSLYGVNIELGKFTVIYGESDVGKSSFYRAIRGMLTTDSGDSFISRGTKQAEVVIYLDSDDTVSWVKRRGQSSEYKLNEQVFRRSKQIPAEISQKLRIMPIVVDGERFYPNLRGQFDSLFLLFDSSLKRARVLGSLISNVLLQGIKEANLERNRNEADSRAASDLRDSIERKLGQDWETLETSAKSMEEVSRITENMIDRKEGIDTLLSEVKELKKIIETQIPVLEEEELFEVEKKLSELEDISASKSAVGIASFDVARLDEFFTETTKKMGLLKTELESMKAKLTIQCPSCGKDISLAEVGIE